MNEELLSQYVDRAAIQADTDFMVGQLKALKENFDLIKSMKLQISGAQSIGQAAQAFDKIKTAQNQATDSANKLAEAAARANAAQKAAKLVNDQLTDTVKKQKTVQDDATASVEKSVSSYEKIIKQLVQNQIASDKLRDQQSQLKKDYADSKITLEQYEASLEKVKTGQQELKISNQDLNKTLNNLEKEAQSAGGSLNELRAQLGLAQQAYDKLSGAEKGSQAGQEILKRVQDLDTAVKGLEFDSGRFGRNVGNYVGAFKEPFKILSSQLDDLKRKMETSDPSSAAFQQTAKQAAVLENILDRVSKGFISSRQEARAFEEAAIQVGLAVGQTDGKFLLLNEAIGEIKNGVQDIKAATAFQAQDAKIIVGITSAVNGLVGAYGAASAAVSLLGHDDEDSQKQMAKFQQLLVLINGLQQVANTLQTESGAIQLALAAKVGLLSAARKIQVLINGEAIKVIQQEVAANIALAESEGAVALSAEEAAAATSEYTAVNAAATSEALTAAAAMEAEAAAAGTATAATTGFTTALIASGIGAIIVAIGVAVAYLVVKIKEWTASSALSVKQQKELSDVLADQVESLQKIADLQDIASRKSLDALQHQLELEEKSGQNQYAILALKEQIAAKNAQIADDKYGTALAQAENKYVKEGLIGIDALHKAQTDYFEDLTAKTYTVSTIQKELSAALAQTDQQREEGGISDKEIDRIKERLDLAKSQQKAAQSNYDFVTKAEKDKTDTQNEQENLRTEKAKLTFDEQIQLELQAAKLRSDATIHSNELILSNEASTRDQRIAATKAILAAEIDSVNAEAAAKLKDPGITDAGRQQVQAQAAADRVKLVKDTREKIRVINVDYDKRDTDARAQQVQAQLTDRINADQVIIDNEKAGYDARLGAAVDSYNKKKEVIGSQMFLELSQVGLTEEQRKAIISKANSALLDNQRTFQKQQLDLFKDNQAKILADAQAFAELRQAQINRDEADAINALNKSLSNNILAVDSYEKRKKQITDKYAIQRLQAQVLADYAVVNSSKEGTAERANAEEKLSKDIEALTSANVDMQRARIKELVSAYEDAGKAIQDAIFAAVEGGLESQKNAIQNQIDLIAKQKDDAIDAENATADAAQDKADKIANINAKAQADTERLQLRQKQLDIQKAKYEKAKSIVEIIERTAAAVAEALPNIPLSIAVGLLGAAQLATVLATPIPQYRYGTGEDGHPGGLAVVGDGGRREPILLPNGDTLLSPSTSTVMDLPRGTIVMPSVEDIYETMRVNAFSRTLAYTGQVQDNGSAAIVTEVKRSMRRVEQAIANKPVAIVKNTFLGVEVSYATAKARWEWVNTNMQS